MKNMQNRAGSPLRAGVGGVLLAHGVQKLFGWLGGGGLAGTGDVFEQMGFWSSARRAPSRRGRGEAGGGALIVLGLFTPEAEKRLRAL